MVSTNNIAAMRDALNRLRDWALLDINENAIRSDEPNYQKLVDGIVEITNAALAAPPEPPGNAAAMREALEAFQRWYEQVRSYVYHSVKLSIAVDEMRDALSAPPRNCDRFDDELDAQLAFLNEEWLISVDRDSMLEKDKFENWTDQMRSAYARWLMATAKGDDDEK